MKLRASWTTTTDGLLMCVKFTIWIQQMVVRFQDCSKFTMHYTRIQMGYFETNYRIRNLSLKLSYLDRLILTLMKGLIINNFNIIPHYLCKNIWTWGLLLISAVRGSLVVFSKAWSITHWCRRRMVFSFLCIWYFSCFVWSLSEASRWLSVFLLSTYEDAFFLIWWRIHLLPCIGYGHFLV